MNIVAQTLALTDKRGAWTAHTLELLGDATKVAARLDGVVATWLLEGSEDGHRARAAPDVETLARHGCRVLRRLRSARLHNWCSEAIAAALAGDTAEGCRVILLPATPPGEEVAALLAVQLQTAWIPDVLTVALTRAGVIEVTAVEPGRKLSRTHRSLDQRPLVVTVRPGVAEARSVEMPQEPVVQDVDLDLSDIPQLTVIEKSLPADPDTVDISFAQRILAGGRGTGGEQGMQLLASLAKALGASVAASRMAVDLGWAPPERQVGQTGKTVRPELYVACGISGASHHLAGMRDSQHIVAINSDTEAPIHEVSHLSLVGDLHQILPAIRSAIARRQAADSAGAAERDGNNSD